MQYRGFNQLELNKISEILDRNGVKYEISLPDEAKEFINDTSKRVNHRFMDNAMQIEIDKEEFDKISAKDIQKLFDLRIYKEEESPFTEEELANLGKEETEKKPVAKKPDEHARMNQVAAILAVLLVTLFFLWKHKII
jgi:hypothetical protein